MAYLTDKLGGAGSFQPFTIGRKEPARRKRRSAEAGTVSYGLPLLVSFFLLWEIAPRLGWLNRIFFPPLSEVLVAWKDLLVSGALAEHIGISLQRASLGFGLAVFVAIPLGFLMGRYSRFEKISDLLVQTLRNTSQFAL